MSHRGDRDRSDREDRRDRDRGDRRRDDREPRREPTREREQARPNRGGGDGLNEFFIDGEGIHREVMQREICKYLGPEAYSRPGAYNGISGYIVKAVRPFTPKMLEDLKDLSEDYIRENREMARRGYQGSLTQASPVAVPPDRAVGVPYGESQTSRRNDEALRDPYVMEARYQSGYSSAPIQSGYPSATNGFTDGSKYPPSQAPGYPPGTGGSGYPPSTNYPAGYAQNAGYPSPSGYGAVSSYASPGYPATAGRPGPPPDPNYTYADPQGDYNSQGYQYSRTGAYPGGPQPRGEPRVPAGYPAYVSAPQDVPMRGAPMDDRYDPYAQSMPQPQPGRGQYVTSRGTPVYDPPPPQPRDGYIREPIRDDRRRGR